MAKTICLKHLSVLLFLLWVLPSAALAGPVVYPVKQVIGFDDPKLAETAPAFAAWVAEVGLPKLADDYAAAFRKKFGQEAVEDIDAANKHRVMVASLHLVRASQYEVPKTDGTKELHLPITLSIAFTNPTTGEVIFCFTDTLYSAARVASSETPQEVEAQLRKVIAANYEQLFPELLGKARASYSPAEISAKVTKIWKGLYILDKGMKAGIARGDDLTDASGGLIKVRYATEDYSVAAPELVSKVEKGQTFSKYANQSLVKQLKKPRVLSMSSGWGDSQLKAVAEFFESELSKNSAFTLLPVNESLQTVLTAVGRDTQMGQFQVSNARSLPDYFLKFTAGDPRLYEISQEGKIGYRIYEQYILGELLDRQGRIVYSAVGQNRIEDENVKGMVLDEKARKEILLKNAVNNLAGQFASAIRFARFTLPVREVDGTVVSLADESRQLRSGQNVLIFHSLGQVDGISGKVLIPIWDAEVKQTKDGMVKVELIGKLTAEEGGEGVKVSNNDVAIIETVSADSAAKNDTSVSYCSDIDSKIGELGVDDFPVLSRAYGYLLPYSLYDNDQGFFQKVKEAIKVGGFRDSLPLAGINTGGRCLLPVQRTKIENRSCTGGSCNTEVRMAMGYRLYSGSAKKGVGSETILSVKQVRESGFDAVVQSEISKNALVPLRDNVIKVSF